MMSMYRLSRMGLRLIYKVRHHRGHSIHSPFVFNLINQVIEEKLPYQRYIDIEYHLEQFPKENIVIRKEDLLSFRLVNYFNSKNILEVGSGLGINTVCMTMPAHDIKCYCLEENKEKRIVAQNILKDYDRNIIFLESENSIPNIKFDCIYINLTDYNNLDKADIENLVTSCHEKSFIVIKGIRNNRKQYKLWKCFTKHDTRTVELDLFDIGILFFDKQFYRWMYQISF